MIKLIATFNVIFKRTCKSLYYPQTAKPRERTRTNVKPATLLYCNKANCNIIVEIKTKEMTQNIQPVCFVSGAFFEDKIIRNLSLQRIL